MAATKRTNSLKRSPSARSFHPSNCLNRIKTKRTNKSNKMTKKSNKTAILLAKAAALTATLTCLRRSNRARSFKPSYANTSEMSFKRSVLRFTPKFSPSTTANFVSHLLTAAKMKSTSKKSKRMLQGSMKKRRKSLIICWATLK